jgi:hypothetical protein
LRCKAIEPAAEKKGAVDGGVSPAGRVPAFQIQIDEHASAEVLPIFLQLLARCNFSKRLS